MSPTKRPLKGPQTMRRIATSLTAIMTLLGIKLNLRLPKARQQHSRRTFIADTPSIVPDYF
jgi:hypothetical protein